MEHVIDKFEEIGFSKNEAKAYMALLAKSPLTGYEISKKSGVPRSMVYAVVEKLVAKEAILELRTDPPTYVPIPVKELVMNRKKQAEETFDFLERELSTIEKPVKVEVIQHLEGRKYILNAMKKLMNDAYEEIWLSLWEEELGDLQTTAETQCKNGKEMYSVLFTDQETDSFGKSFYHHKHTSTIEKQRMGQRLSIVIKDHEEVLIAGFIDGQIPQAIQTKDMMLILLAKEYIRHDMMMKIVGNKFGHEQLDALWRKDDLLTYIVQNEKKQGE
ncbi:TrmB family transcriptional regulator [Bacillus sp. VT-16-64]|nr:TrmB family transcriptional regulator [Bacillus sp. VT-16-64]